MERYNWVYRASQNFCFGALNTLFNLSIEGIENLPIRGAFILACNHASHIDPPLLGAGISRELFFFARKSLFRPGFAKKLLDRLNTIPVDRDGDSDVTALKKTLNCLKQGEGLVLFPEGTRTKDGQIGAPKAGVGLIACKSQVPVIPALLIGTYEALKTGRVFPQWGEKISVCFGKPLMPAEYDKDNTGKTRYLVAADIIMDAIKKLELPLHLSA